MLLQITIRVIEKKSENTVCISDEKDTIKTKKICCDRKNRSREIFAAAKTICNFTSTSYLYNDFFGSIVYIFFSHIHI